MPSAEVWIGLAGIFTSVLVAVFIYGQLTQRVDGHEKTLDGHAKMLDGHAALFISVGDRMSGHELKIDRLEQWRSGFSDAANVAHASSAITAARVAEATDRRAASVAAEVVAAAERLRG